MSPRRATNSRYRVEERTHGDRTEFSVVDEINGDELGRMSVVDGGILRAYALPDIGDPGSRAIADPFLVEALGEMFSRSAALLKKTRGDG